MKEEQSISIIGGADGPTSIFLAGKTKTGKKPIKHRIRNFIYKCRRKRIEKKICAGEHTLEEVVAYADKKYGITEVHTTQHKYVEQRKCLRESLILKHKPQLLGDHKEVASPDVYDEDSVKKMFQQIKERSERIALIPDNEMPMDFHIYEIKTEHGLVEIEIEFIWNVFGVSCSGSRHEMKRLKQIMQDLYCYYGVTQEDIKTKSERYASLVTMLVS